MDRFVGALQSSPAGEWAPAKSAFRTAFCDEEATQPSPRAEHHILTGEWDSAPEHALIRLMESELGDVCRSGTATKGTFCVNRSLASGETCVIGSHQKQIEVKPGWCVAKYSGAPTSPAAAVGSRRVAFLEPHVMLDCRFNEPMVAEKLLDPEKPLRLSIGRWKFLFDTLNDDEPAPILPAASSGSSGVLVDPASSGDDEQSLSSMLKSLDDFDGRPSPGGGVPETKDADADEESVGADPGPNPGAADLELAFERIEALEGAVLKITSANEALEEVIEDAAEALQAREQRVLKLETSEAQLRRTCKRLLTMVQDTSRSSAEPTAATNERFNMEEIVQGLRKVKVGLSDVKELVRSHDKMLSDPNGAIESLRISISDLEQKLTHGGAEHGEHKWSSPREFRQWIGNRAGTPTGVSHGLFFDAMSTCHGMSTGTSTFEKGLSEEHSIKKIEACRSKLEARVGTSCATGYPDVFGSSGRDDFMKDCDTCEKWKDPGKRKGLACILQKALATDMQSVTTSINHRITNSELHSLAVSMLMTTQTFMTAFIQFGEEVHCEMSLSDSMNAQDAWDLTKNMMGEVFRQIRDARNAVADIREYEPEMHIWGAFKAHMVMKEFTLAFFRDHPSLTGIQTRFLVKRKGDKDGVSTNLTRLTSRVTSLEMKHNAVAQQVKDLVKEASKKN